jgi:hypothetical protein
MAPATVNPNGCDEASAGARRSGRDVADGGKRLLKKPAHCAMQQTMRTR